MGVGQRHKRGPEDTSPPHPPDLSKKKKKKKKKKQMKQDNEHLGVTAYTSSEA